MHDLKELDSIYLAETSELQIHPSNSKIYYDHSDAIFDEDIKINGIRNPLVINKQFQILDGTRRFNRAISFKIAKIPVIIRNYEDEELAIVMLNKYRTKTAKEIFLESKILERKYKEIYRPGKPCGKSPTLVQEMGKESSVKAKVASELGFGRDKLEQLHKVFENEDKIPQIAEALDKGTISVNKAAQAAELVLEEGLSEDKVLRKAIKSDRLSSPIKKRALPILKQYVVNCPLCKGTLITTKEITLYTVEQARHMKKKGNNGK